MKQINYLNFKNHHIYVGLDVHHKNWVVSIHTEKIFHDTFTQDPKPEILIKYLKRNFPNGSYHSVYEAGFSGFWIHEQLKAGGIDSTGFSNLFSLNSKCLSTYKILKYSEPSMTIKEWILTKKNLHPKKSWWRFITYSNDFYKNLKCFGQHE